MSKPLLIIICDFLLISLLSLASFDQEPDKAEGPAVTKGADAQSAKDMLDVLTLALEAEQSSQESLESELNALKSDLTDTQSTLQDRETSLESIQSNLAKTEEKAKELEKQKTRLEKEFDTTQQTVTFLQNQYLNTKEEAAKVKNDLASTSKDAAVSQAKLDTIQSELTVRRQDASNMQRKIEDLEKERRAAEAEKFKLALDLKQSQTVAIVVKEQLAVARDDVDTARSDVAFSRQELVNARSEVKFARTEVAVARDEVDRVVDEKKTIQRHADQLATGVNSLAQKSEEIKDEIRNSTPLTANSIYNEFRNNQIDTRFFAAKSGLFGQRVTREKKTKSIIATDGTRYYILYHIDDTPLSLVNTDASWEQLTGVVSKGSVSYSIPVLSDLAMDPRILVVPVGLAQAERLGSKIYPLAEDPYKFQEAVLVGSQESYFGEVSFQLDPKHPSYVKMERQSLGKLFGKFTPSRGDLVFSKTGELLGIMANSKYCTVFKDIKMNRKLKFGIEVLEKDTSRVLGQMRSQFQKLPFQLQ
jgi:hypothetical protein